MIDDLVLQRLVLLFEPELVDVVTFEEPRVAGVDDSHLLHHLADDDLDVLVVDLHALDPVHFLDFVHEVFLHRADALDPQDVMRVDGAVGEALAGTDDVVLLDQDVLAERDRILPHVLPVVARDDDLARSALLGAEPDGAVDLRDDCRIVRAPRLEELGDPGADRR